MIVTLSAFLFLVPAPMTVEAPKGAPPVLQFLKWKEGEFEIAQPHPYIETYIEKDVKANGKLVTKTRTVYKIKTVTKSSIDAEVYDLQGKKIEEAVWQKALGKGAIVLLPADGQLPDSSYLSTFKEGMLIVLIKNVPLMFPPPPNFGPVK